MSDESAELDGVKEILARVILKMKEWSYDMFSEGDYSKEFSDLEDWAKETLAELSKEGRSE